MVVWSLDEFEEEFGAAAAAPLPPEVDMLLPPVLLWSSKLQYKMSKEWTKVSLHFAVKLQQLFSLSLSLIQ